MKKKFIILVITFFVGTLLYSLVVNIKHYGYSTNYMTIANKKQKITKDTSKLYYLAPWD